MPLLCLLLDFGCPHFMSSLHLQKPCQIFLTQQERSVQCIEHPKQFSFCLCRVIALVFLHTISLSNHQFSNCLSPLLIFYEISLAGFDHYIPASLNLSSEILSWYILSIYNFSDTIHNHSELWQMLNHLMLLPFQYLDFINTFSDKYFKVT